MRGWWRAEDPMQGQASTYSVLHALLLFESHHSRHKLEWTSMFDLLAQECPHAICSPGSNRVRRAVVRSVLGL